MKPTSSNLSKLLHKTISLDVKLVAQPTGGLITASWPVTVTVDGSGNVALERKKGSDSGLWIPYAETKAVVGHASGGETWLASGPFSGCEFAVGLDRKTGTVFGAHIARQSGSTGPQDWADHMNANDYSIWYQNRIPLPSDTFYACSYIFAEFGGTGLLSMTRLDVQVTTMGGGNGTVFNVKIFK